MKVSSCNHLTFELTKLKTSCSSCSFYRLVAYNRLVLLLQYKQRGTWISKRHSLLWDHNK